LRSGWPHGQDIVLPNAAGINLATEARGTDPFTPFIDHQDKCIVLLATGGTLTSLAQADTGSLAGGAQMEVWREIVARDGVAVADALNRHLFRRYLELEFPGRPMAAKFVMSNEKKPTAGEIADLAVKIKSAGYTVDQAQLEEKTGLKLVKDETPAPQPGMGAPFMNKEVKELPNSAVHLESTPTPILEAFAKDTGPAADAIKALLKTIESGGDGKAEAASLIEKLPELMPEDPAMAAVIAEAMAAEFTDAASGTDGRSARDAQPLANKNWHKCPKCGKFSGFDGHCGKCNFTLTGNDAKKRTSAILDAAARDTYAKPVTGLAYREGLGRIDLPVGKLGIFEDGERKHGTGLSKIRAKHDEDLEHLSDTLTFGEILRTRHYDDPANPENPNRKAIVYKGFVCFVARRGDAWEITTHYKPKDDTVATLKTIAEAL
jgi:hypothetical protein